MKEYKSKWLTFYPKKHKLCLTLEWGSYFDPYPEIHFSLGWGEFFLRIPYNTGRDECENPEYGFYLYGEQNEFFTSIWFKWGYKYKCFHMPWKLQWYRTSKLLKNGSWETETKNNRKDFWKNEWKDQIWSETHPYTYRLSEDKVQDDINATISVYEMEWRPRWLMWTDKFSLKRRNIDIDFDKEVGSKRGSWKGGVTGCSYELLPNETPLECLRRMEKERKFR